ncbi:hypothetical protein AWB81_08081 [Caballeronia arationis]|jgi:hypothetical protein|uniref:Uncharacterized protein n=1 Tax=Caballeronia arationis TaxID=1777142 RepID=A0A7Z7N1U0_9BURK|nr:hypothetical protein [Caballeronia arationis]SAL07427.1 hypothetical protein AWB81_08081 [Caballeronia arationis]SOE57431.1 hypothetical protein SAMN05446927_1440 [Caballeronia arationis]
MYRHLIVPVETSDARIAFLHVKRAPALRVTSVMGRFVKLIAHVMPQTMRSPGTRK